MPTPLACVTAYGASRGSGREHSSDRAAQQSCVAVHCVAGLGRAPLLVALGLMEIGKIGPVEAVQYIRAQRRGAINAHQLRFLEQYEPRRAKVGCVIE